MATRNKTFSLAFLLSLFFLPGCSPKHPADKSELFSEADTLTVHSELLTLVRLNEGITLVEIKNPWKPEEKLNSFLLVDKEVDVNDLPSVADYRKITVPVKSALVYSSVHMAPLIEIGSEDVITGIADLEYISDNTIRKRISDGQIVDIGNSMSPSLEKIIALSPQIALISPYQNSGHGVLDNTNIEVIDMADYMETTPLGRAEWIKLLGLLTGKYEKTDSIYNEISERYDNIKHKTASHFDSKTRPLVITEIPFNGVWYQPGQKSYMATLIHDAGGRTLDVGEQTNGSVQLDIATVLNKGANSDIWLIKTTQNLNHIKDLEQILPSASLIKAYRDKNVWYCNTTESNLYDDLAFHPELILTDFVNIIFGDNASQNRYFVKPEE